MKNNNTNKTEANVQDEVEVEVLTVTSADEDKPAETATDEDTARKLVEDKYGDEYDIERVVVDGSVINFIGKRKGDTTAVAIRVKQD